MDITDLLWPKDWLARGTIIALWSIAFVWLLMLIGSLIRHLRTKKQMLKCSDIKTLLYAIDTHALKRDQSVARHEYLKEPGLSGTELGAKLATETSSKPSAEEADIIFATFSREKDITNPLLVKHIKAIFNAGVEGNNLDVGELIQHSSRELFQVNSLLRSLLAIFIVIGLLGTLFGLAKSLANLSHLLKINDQISNEKLVPAMQSLLTSLETAFAPSIWGVGLTIIGVLIFGFYLSLICAPLKATLDSLTLTVWVPKLLPTVSQKQLDALQRSEKQLREHHVIAGRVVDFARDLDHEVGKLGRTIIHAESSLDEMTVLTKDISEFSKDFSDSVIKLTNFQEDLTTLYNQIQEKSDFFQNYVQNTITESDKNHKEMLQVLQNQNEQLRGIMESLDVYEKAYAEERKKIDSRSEQVLSSAQSLFQEMGQKNRELIEELGKPLNVTLAKNLGEIKRGLNVDMSSIADKMGNSIDTIINRTDKIVKELREEFNTRNAVNSQILQSQTQFLTSLQEQSRLFQLLNSTIANLASKVESLNLSRATTGPRPTSSNRTDGDRSSSGSPLERLIQELLEETKYRNRSWFSRTFRGR
jgi:hypothetical protein